MKISLRDRHTLPYMFLRERGTLPLKGKKTALLLKLLCPKPAKLGLAVPPKEIPLLMFVCYPYPRKVMQFLQRTSVRIEENDPGIYRSGSGA